MIRIKEISQRDQNGNFPAFYPIGTDGILVDMLSGSNLEEEMHLGSPSNTSFDIDEVTKMMIITEKYKRDGQTDYYIMVTTFNVVDNAMKIYQKLYFKEVKPETLKKTKIVSFISNGKKLEIKEEVN